MRLVLVYWLDIVSECGWEDVAEYEHPLEDAQCVSVGWVLADCEGWLILTATRGEKDSSCNSRVRIPKGCITQIVEVSGSEANHH